MSKRLGSTLKGLFATSLLVTNVVVFFSAIVPVALVKLVLPSGAMRRGTDRTLNAIAQGWIAVDNWWMAFVERIRWDVAGVDNLHRKGWYLMTSNHQSWVDILVLQKVFHRRVPFLKFFLKRQLLYVPIMGLAWWALDFPFMRRRSGSRSRDLAATRKACERFRQIPTTVMCFLEGTRFSRAKCHQQGSPYRHLLKPRLGALTASLAAMGGCFKAVLDVTIIYPAGVPSFWDLLSGKLTQVIVRVRELEIPKGLLDGDYTDDPILRARIQTWVQKMWAEKDAHIEKLLSSHQSLVEA